MDNEDPVDVIELGSRQRPVGSITAVKMLGNVGLHKKTVKRRIRLQNVANMMVFALASVWLVSIFGRAGLHSTLQSIRKSLSFYLYIYICIYISVGN